MSIESRDPATGEIESQETYCYGHPKTPTKLRCSRCERPICGRCAIPASVGQHCPECVAEARRSTPKVRSAATKNAPAVVGVIAVTAISFVAQLMIPSYQGDLASVPVFIAQGEWWRLFTPVLVHAGFLHIAMNMMVLYIYGQNAEEGFGTIRFLVIYAVSALTGSAFSYAFSDAFGGSVGASGAVFGVVGALIVYLYNRRSSQFIAQHLRGMMGFLAINFVIGLMLPNIDVMAHLGGLLGGLALGFAFDRSRGAAKATSPLALQLIAVAVVVGGAALLVMSRTAALTGF